MTVLADPALGFWLRHVAAAGGLWEPEGPAAYVVLPPPLRDAYRLPEELRVTADPDVAREDGAALLAAGHPVLAEAADRVLTSGDAGQIVIARPASVPPGREVLLTELRDVFPVGHGRIDLAGEPEVVLHPVARIGALVTYELSAEDRFQEQAERWVDVPARRELPVTLAAYLVRAEISERNVAPPAEGLLPAIGEAHRLIDAGATARREALGAEMIGAWQAESGRAAAYYADAIAGIERRLATAPADRRAVLEQRLRSTWEEQARRLAEIAEKYEARHTIRPYRLHVIHVPGLRVPVDVRRGDRRYPMTFDWLLPAGAYAPVRCPSCGGEAPLVAGKAKLGCETCLPPKSFAALGSAGPVPSASGTPRSTRSAPAPKPVPPQAKRPAVVPPKVRKEQQKATATLAERLWCAVAADDRRAVSRILHPGSPAGVARPGTRPRRALPGPRDAPGRGPGEVPRGDRRRCHHRGAAWSPRYRVPLSYLLPGRPGSRGAALPRRRRRSLLGFYWWGQRPGGRWAVSGIVLAKGLDPVEGALAVTGSAWNGLPVAARALASWGRIAAHQERLLSAHAAQSLAAAVNRLVACRAGGRATFATAAARFRVPEQDVRRSDRAVRALLALGPGQPWSSCRDGRCLRSPRTASTRPSAWLPSSTRSAGPR